MAYQPKSYRKFLATSVTAAAMVATIAAPGIPTASAADAGFKDSIPEWAEDSVSYLLEKGAIEGYPDGTYRADGAITRAEAAKIIALSLDLDVDGNAVADFPDTKTHWGTSYIAALVDEGILEGYPSGNFLPDGKITRQEMAKIVAVAYDLELDTESTNNTNFPDNNDWGADYITILASLGIVEGRATGFYPAANVTRAETAVFVHRTEVEEVRIGADLAVLSAKALDETTVQVSFNDGQTQNFTVDKLEVGKSTEVEIEYKGQTFKVTVTWDPATAVAPGTVAFADQPTGKALPFSSQLNEVYNFQVTAGEDDITLRSVQLKQYGTARASSDDVATVHLAVNGETRATGTLNANGEVRLTRSITIPANSTAKFTVLADINQGGENGATPTATVQFGVESINAFTANAKLNGSFPNVGNSFSIVAGNIGNVKVTKGSNLSDVSTGDIQAELGKFSLQAGSQEGVKVKRITLTSSGLNADDIENLYLYENNGRDRIEVQGVATRNEVVFDLAEAGIEIGRNQSKAFVLKGDPASYNENGVEFKLEQTYHLVAEGLNTGYNNGNDIRTADRSEVSLGKVNIKLGEPKFRVSTNTPKTGDKIVASTSDYGVVREYTLNPSGQEVTLKSGEVVIHWDGAKRGNDTQTNLKDAVRSIELYDATTGSVIKTLDVEQGTIDNTGTKNKVTFDVSKVGDLNWYVDKAIDLQVRAVATSTDVSVAEFDVLITKLGYEVQLASGKNESDDLTIPVTTPQFKEFTTQGNIGISSPGAALIDGYSISGGLSSAPLGGFRVEAKNEALKVTDVKIAVTEDDDDKLYGDKKLSKLIANPVLKYDGEIVGYGDVKDNGTISFSIDDEFIVETGSSNRKILKLEADILESDDVNVKDIDFGFKLNELKTRGVNSNIASTHSFVQYDVNDDLTSHGTSLLEKDTEITYRDTTVAINVSSEAIDTVASSNTNILKFTIDNLAPNDDASKKAIISAISFENLFTFPENDTEFVLRNDKLEVFKNFSESNITQVSSEDKVLTLTQSTGAADFVLDGDSDEEVFLYGNLTEKHPDYDNRSIYSNVRMRLDATNWVITENLWSSGDKGDGKIIPLFINEKGPDITIRD